MIEIAVMAGFHRGLQAGAMIEGQQHVTDRGAIGHDYDLAWALEGPIVFPRNRPSLNSPKGAINCHRGVRLCNLGPWKQAGEAAITNRSVRATGPQNPVQIQPKFGVYPVEIAWLPL
jgi:hypothetical protein